MRSNDVADILTAEVGGNTLEALMLEKAQERAAKEASRSAGHEDDVPLSHGKLSRRVLDESGRNEDEREDRQKKSDGHEGEDRNDADNDGDDGDDGDNGKSDTHGKGEVSEKQGGEGEDKEERENTTKPSKEPVRKPAEKPDEKKPADKGPARKSVENASGMNKDTGGESQMEEKESREADKGEEKNVREQSGRPGALWEHPSPKSKEQQEEQKPGQQPPPAQQQQQTQQQPVQQQPVQNPPLQSQPVRGQPVKNQPGQGQPLRNPPAQNQPVQQQHVSQQPVSQQPVSQQPAKQQQNQQPAPPPGSSLKPPTAGPIPGPLPGPGVLPPPGPVFPGDMIPPLTAAPPSPPPTTPQQIEKLLEIEHFSRPLDRDDYYKRNFNWVRCHSNLVLRFSVGGGWAGLHGRNVLRQLKSFPECADTMGWRFEYINKEGFGDAMMSWDTFWGRCNPMLAVYAMLEVAREAEPLTHRKLYVYGCPGFRELDDYVNEPLRLLTMNGPAQ